MEYDQKAYDHYIALCIAHGVMPLSFDGWQTLMEGEVPEELQ